MSASNKRSKYFLLFLREKRGWIRDIKTIILILIFFLYFTLIKKIQIQMIKIIIKILEVLINLLNKFAQISNKFCIIIINKLDDLEIVKIFKDVIYRFFFNLRNYNLGFYLRFLGFIFGLIYLIFRCYYDFNYLFIFFRNVILYQMFIWFLKKFVFKFINKDKILYFLLIMLVLIMLIVCLLFIYDILNYLYNISYMLFMYGCVNYLGDSDKLINNNDSIFYSDTSSDSSKTNSSRTGSGSDSDSQLKGSEAKLNVRANIKDVVEELKAIVPVATSVGAAVASSKVGVEAMKHVGGGALTKIGAGVGTTVATYVEIQSSKAIVESQHQNDKIKVDISVSGSKPDSDGKIKADITIKKDSGSSDKKDVESMDSFDGNLVEINDSFVTPIIYQTPLICSMNDVMSPLENILENLFSLNICLITSMIIISNFLLVRLILRRYKSFIINSLTKIVKNKINISRIVDNILIYNLNFYNFLIKINIFLIIVFLFVIFYSIFDLYLNVLNYVVVYNISPKIYNKNLNDNINIDYLNSEYISSLEYYLNLLVYNNLLIIIIILLFIYYMWKKKKNIYVENKNILIKLVFSISILLLIIGIIINLYFISDIIKNLNSYVLEYSNLHILLNSIFLISVRKDKLCQLYNKKILTKTFKTKIIVKSNTTQLSLIKDDLDMELIIKKYGSYENYRSNIININIVNDEFIKDKYPQIKQLHSSKNYKTLEVPITHIIKTIKGIKNKKINDIFNNRKIIIYKPELFFIEVYNSKNKNIILFKKKKIKKELITWSKDYNSEYYNLINQYYNLYLYYISINYNCSLFISSDKNVNNLKYITNCKESLNINYKHLFLNIFLIFGILLMLFLPLIHSYFSCHVLADYNHDNLNLFNFYRMCKITFFSFITLFFWFNFDKFEKIKLFGIMRSINLVFNQKDTSTLSNSSCDSDTDINPVGGSETSHLNVEVNTSENDKLSGPDLNNLNTDDKSADEEVKSKWLSKVNSKLKRWEKNPKIKKYKNLNMQGNEYDTISLNSERNFKIDEEENDENTLDFPTKFIVDDDRKEKVRFSGTEDIKTYEYEEGEILDKRRTISDIRKNISKAKIEKKWEKKNPLLVELNKVDYHTKINNHSFDINNDEVEIFNEDNERETNNSPLMINDQDVNVGSSNKGKQREMEFSNSPFRSKILSLLNHKNKSSFFLTETEITTRSNISTEGNGNNDSDLLNKDRLNSKDILENVNAGKTTDYLLLQKHINKYHEVKGDDKGDLP